MFCGLELPRAIAQKQQASNGSVSLRPDGLHPAEVVAQAGSMIHPLIHPVHVPRSETLRNAVASADEGSQIFVFFIAGIGIYSLTLPLSVPGDSGTLLSQPPSRILGHC